MIPLIRQFAGNNTTQVTVSPSLTLYFSYETCVAFRHNGELVASQNAWSSTTGKHLNAIPGYDKSEALPYEEFTGLLSEVCS